MAGRRQNSTRADDAAVTRLLVERARVSFGVTLAGLGVLLVIDAASDHQLLGALVGITVFQASCIGIAFPVLRRVRTRRAAAIVPVIAVAGIFSAGVLSDVITRNPFGTGLGALACCLVSATFMPWGRWFQLAIVLATAVPGLLSIWLCTGSLERLGYAAGPSSILLLASVGVAGAFERTRRERARIERELRLLQSVSLEVGAAPDLESALTAVLRRICEATDWVLGQAWCQHPESGALACSAWWSADPAAAAVDLTADGPEV